MAAPAKPLPVVAKAPAKGPTDAFALQSEGTGPERVWLALRLRLQDGKVIDTVVLERTRWRDVAEDVARRGLWGKAR